MNPFARSGKETRRFPLNRWRTSAGIPLALACLCVGLSLVGWGARRNLASARARARAEAQSIVNAIAQQFAQAQGAADLLAAWVKQNGSAVFPFNAAAP